MKYIITDNRFIKLINNYLQIKYPEVFDLTRLAMRMNQQIVGYSFRDDMEDKAYFWFNIEDPFVRGLEEDYPQLQVENNLYQDVIDMFGEEGVEYLIDWFEKYYGLRAKQITT